MPDSPRDLAMENLALNGTTIGKVDGEDKVKVNSITLADSEDISSIDIRVEDQEDEQSTDTASLNSRVSTQEVARTNEYSSLTDRIEDQEDEQSTDTASINARLDAEEKTTKISLDIPVSGNASHINIDYTSMGFSDNGNVKICHGQLRDAANSITNPILASQISGAASHTGCTFIFSDDVPENTSSTVHGENSDYFIDIVVCEENQND